MSGVTEISFLCDKAILPTTTNAQVGRRASDFVQVGQHPGKRRSTISADFSSENAVRGTEEDAANGRAAAASGGMADRFKNDREPLPLPIVRLQAVGQVYPVAWVYAHCQSPTAKMFHFKVPIILLHAYSRYPSIDRNRRTLSLYARSKDRSRVAISEWFQPNDFRPYARRLFHA